MLCFLNKEDDCVVLAGYSETLVFWVHIVINICLLHRLYFADTCLNCCPSNCTLVCLLQRPEAPLDHPRFLTPWRHNRFLGAVAGCDTLFGRTLHLILGWQAWVPPFGFLTFVSPDFLLLITNHSAPKTLLPGYRASLWS